MPFNLARVRSCIRQATQVTVLHRAEISGYFFGHTLSAYFPLKDGVNVRLADVEAGG